jgi:hypothetical protein
VLSSASPEDLQQFPIIMMRVSEPFARARNVVLYYSKVVGLYISVDESPLDVTRGQSRPM